MKNFILLLLILIGFSACSKNIHASSCCEIVSMSKTYKYKHIHVLKPLDVARGYERIGKILFMDKLIKNFTAKVKNYSNELYYATSVSNSYVDGNCIEAKQIIDDYNYDQNSTRKSTRLYAFEAKWIASYKKSLSTDLVGKLKFNKLDGCEKEASNFEKVLFDRKSIKDTSMEHYENIQIIYNDCLYMSNKKKRQLKIKKSKGETNGN